MVWTNSSLTCAKKKINYFNFYNVYIFLTYMQNSIDLDEGIKKIWLLKTLKLVWPGTASCLVYNVNNVAIDLHITKPTALTEYKYTCIWFKQQHTFLLRTYKMKKKHKILMITAQCVCLSIILQHICKFTL